MSMNQGMSGAAVINLQTNLNQLGFKLTADGNFGAVTKLMVQNFQSAHGLTPDGVVGPVTQAAIAKALANQAAPVPLGPTPWMDWMTAHKGMNEAKNDAQLAKLLWINCQKFCWSWTSVVGTEREWCAATVGSALIYTGYAGSHDASAISYKEYGIPCEMKFGAICVILHTSGGHHVTFFHSWVDQAKGIANFFGGNQDNAIQISTYNISGNKYKHDEIIACRWPVKE